MDGGMNDWMKNDWVDGWVDRGMPGGVDECMNK